MSVREFLKEVLYTYFIVVTLVVVSTFVLGTIFQPEQTFGYEAFLSPLLYGLFGVIPMLIMYSKKELSIKQILIRKVFQLVALEALLLAINARLTSFLPEDRPLFFSFVFSVFIIFVLVHLISFVLDCDQAARMNRDLAQLQENNQEET